MKSIVVKIINKVCYILQKIITKKKAEAIVGYEKVFPVATFAPWLVDDEFDKVYNIVKDYTLVDKYRCFELWQLITETSMLKGSIIEIGVWKGGTAGIIAYKSKKEGISDTIFLADTFSGVVKASDLDKSYNGGEHSDTNVDEVKHLLEIELGLDNFELLQGVFPDDVSHKISDSTKFKFCHIDVDVYNSAKDIVDWIWDRLCIGGVIVFDDYGFLTCNGITKFVNEERKKHDRIVIHNLNGHAIMIKTK